MKPPPFTKSEAIRICSKLSYVKDISFQKDGRPYRVYDIVIWPMDKITNAGNKMAIMYNEIIHKKGKMQDVIDFLNSFDEDEEFDVAAVLISPNALVSNFFTISYPKIECDGLEYYFGFQSNL